MEREYLFEDSVQFLTLASLALEIGTVPYWLLGPDDWNIGFLALFLLDPRDDRTLASWLCFFRSP